jgi:1-acyl-sn-glycerol-3-phosphate acyltransferase
MAMGRRHRPLAAWYGDLDFIPHIKAFIARGAVDAMVSYGEPVAVDGAIDRKALTRRLEGAVRRLMTAALLRRPQSASSGPTETAVPVPAPAAAP